jgi:cell division protein FtsB
LSSSLRRFAIVLVVVGVGSYAAFLLRGPQGIPALIEKWEEVRKLERENAELAEKIRQKKERIRRLDERGEELELELRKEMLQVKPGEKILILPESEVTPAEPPSQ